MDEREGDTARLLWLGAAPFTVTCVGGGGGHEHILTHPSPVVSSRVVGGPTGLKMV